MHGHRNSVACRFRIRQDVIDRLKADPALRIMVYCAADVQLGMFTRLDISFPFQVELKVNNVEVKANFRGLKNKPGSTKPVDITPHVRLVETLENLVVMTYAMTTQVRYRCAAIALVFPFLSIKAADIK
jgi:E3 SUMO-protein ligase PIAS1